MEGGSGEGGVLVSLAPGQGPRFDQETGVRGWGGGGGKVELVEENEPAQRD